MMSPWSKDQDELSNLLIEIGWEDWASDQRALSIGSVLYLMLSLRMEGPWGKAGRSTALTVLALGLQLLKRSRSELRYPTEEEVGPSPET